MNGYSIHLQRILRNKMILAATMAIPLLMLIYGCVGTGTLPRAAVIVEDSGPLAEILLESISGVYRIEQIRADQAERVLRQGAADYILRVPEDFGTRLLRGEMPVLSGRSAHQQQHELYMREAVQQFMQSALIISRSLQPEGEQELADAVLAELQSRPVVDEYIDNQEDGISSMAASSYQSGMNLFTLIMMLMGLYGGMNLIRDRHSGTIMRASATPAGLKGYIGGLMTALMSVQLLQVAITSVVALLVFPEISIAVALRGFLAMSVFALTGVSFGVAIAGVAKNMNQLGVLGSICIFPMSVLGGSFLPVDSMPEFMQRAALLVPNYWAGRSVRVAVEQGPLAEFLLPLAILCAFSAVFFLLGSWKRDQITSGREMRV